MIGERRGEDLVRQTVRASGAVEGEDVERVLAGRSGLGSGRNVGDGKARTTQGGAAAEREGGVARDFEGRVRRERDVAWKSQQRQEGE